MPDKTFTKAEWEELTKNDEVLAFVKRVGELAIAKDYWHEDFRRALYDTLYEEHSKHCMNKYNNGEEFVIR